MMSLKPRNVDFTETWAHLKETVAGVVGLRAVERSVWNTRFSDVYALCVAHPEPLADRLYDETRKFLEEHVAGLLQRVRASADLDTHDHNDGLLTRYVTAWREYSQGVAYLNSLYSYLNLQHVKRQKVSDAEIIYGSSATVTCPEHDARQLEVGELGLEIWERVLSTVQVRAFRPADYYGNGSEVRVACDNVDCVLRLFLTACVRERRRLQGRNKLVPINLAHTHFVNAMLTLHGKYSKLFGEVFGGAQAFVGALDKACSAVVNSRLPLDATARAPELLARYCDCLLRKRAGADADVDDKLAAAIVVFKYVDDKDVFQKYYARALARRLIHQLSASMEQEEAMINRLKAACGYEFTNKLHRMFTDVAVSADLNAKFQQHLRDNHLATSTGFFIQVLQAGAWPLGGAMAPLAPPQQLERPARLFEAFYRASFSGRRLAWLHHLCTGELRTRYTPRLYHVSATTAQCALLLSFESEDSWSARDLRDATQLAGDAWHRHLRPLLDAGLLIATGEVGAEPDTEPAADASLALNLAFSCKRSKLRLTCANAPSHAGAGAGGAAGGAAAGEADAAHCDDDRKMYLQAAIVRIMKQRKVLRHTELIQEVVSQARGSFAPSVAMIKKCIEALIDKQYLERAPAALDTYSYLA
uniref:Cullin family profile domain-containing protein n=1 Tax=Heliothis virescens TaxID=7102 RepID=A0A2A4JF66_HELVI